MDGFPAGGRKALDCGLYENGFARIRCPECAEEYLLAFSCKTRELCPSCSAKRSAGTAALLSEERTELLLSWRHTGFLGVASFGRSSKPCRSESVPTVIPASRRRRRHLILPWQGAVHNRVYVEPEDQPAVERLARYIIRPPISLERMCWDGEGEVRYRRKGGHEDPASRLDPVETFDPSEFLARVIMHIPEPRRHMVRYYGSYSNVSRGKRRLRGEAAGSACPSGEGQAPSGRAKKDQGPDTRALRRSWAQLIKRIYEIDPLVCPSCGGEMKVVAFIIDHAVVDKILTNLKRRAEYKRERGPPGRSKLAAVL